MSDLEVSFILPIYSEDEVQKVFDAICSGKAADFFRLGLKYDFDFTKILIDQLANSGIGLDKAKSNSVHDRPNPVRNSNSVSSVNREEAIAKALGKVKRDTPKTVEANTVQPKQKPRRKSLLGGSRLTRT